TYAADLRAHRYYRLDPIADLFWRIYNGSPTTRADAAGTHALFVDVHGHVFPTEHMTGDDYGLGDVVAQGIDERRRASFDDTGVALTPPCIRCWARHLCGGGPVAVHAARTGNFNTPDPVWCDEE